MAEKDFPTPPFKVGDKVVVNRKCWVNSWIGKIGEVTRVGRTFYGTMEGSKWRIYFRPDGSLEEVEIDPAFLDKIAPVGRRSGK